MLLGNCSVMYCYLMCCLTACTSMVVRIIYVLCSFSRMVSLRLESLSGFVIASVHMSAARAQWDGGSLSMVLN